MAVLIETAKNTSFDCQTTAVIVQLGAFLCTKSGFQGTKMKHFAVEGAIGQTPNQMQESKTEGEHTTI